MLAIELRNVSARYGASHFKKESARAHTQSPLSKVTLNVRPGEVFAVLGPNGAGKSTLMRVMAGTIAASEGEVRLLGESIAKMDRREIARRLAVVTQTEQVAFGFRVRDVVLMGRAPHQGAWLGVSDRDRAIVDRIMGRLDLVRIADRAVDELSGGEQKRVSIARALAQEPKVLLLDEPAAFLDIRHQLELYELLVEEAKENGRACVVVMHDLNAAAQYADKVGLFAAGQLVASGSIEEVLTYARLRETFDADLYVGVNELTKDRFFVPMRKLKP